ncbi:hypothetical protein BGX27_006017, partial [Mortierella sp. AM989]
SNGRNSAKSNPATDLSMDGSLLERRFREKLDAAIPASNYTKTESSRQSPISGQQLTASKTDVPPTKNEGGYGSLTAEQQRQRDRYHSSYSPSDFSQEEEEEEEEDTDEEEEQDTVEFQRTVGPEDATRPNPLPSPTRISVQQPQPQTLPVKDTKDTQPRPQSQFTNPNNGLDHRGYGNEDISFEREVAIARARRQLGTSADKRNNANTGPSGTHPVNGSVLPTTTA